ncbi:MAG TPA: quinone-dependent dihydroorotate dehydrogenase [Verrucomicrobiales bacterium]|nr:quinone-dependent dihydroorotate dehydrogenase [Verrucomicrobiales bacterium]
MNFLRLAACGYPLLRPLLFALNPELAHHLTIRALAWFQSCGFAAPSSPSGPSTPSLRIMGLDFPNRLGLAAGLDKGAECIDAFAALGFGSVEVGTLTPRPQAGNAQPRLFRLPSRQALINRMGFNNPGMETAIARIQRRRSRAILGVNIGKNFDTPLEHAAGDYLACLRAAYPHAGYIAVNLSSPNTQGLRQLQSVEHSRPLLQALIQEQERLTAQTGRWVPIAVKIAPDLEDTHIDELASLFLELGLDGVIATNTTVSRPGLEGIRHAAETGGLSGAPLHRRSTEVVARLHQCLQGRIPVIGSGGILSAADAREKLQAGAALVQIYTGLVYRGPALVREILQLPEAVA